MKRIQIFFENLIYKAVFLVELSLLVRFLLKLLGANPKALFVETWYRFTDPLAMPFFHAFSNVTWFDRFVFDTSTLFAMIVYLLGMHIVLTLLRFLFEESSS